MTADAAPKKRTSAMKPKDRTLRQTVRCSTLSVLDRYEYDTTHRILRVRCRAIAIS